MDVLDKFLKKYSYKFDKGYPDMDNPKDKEKLFEFAYNLIEQEEEKKLTKNEVALSEAIKIAISSFKNDYDEGNQSPLDIILEKSFENYLEGLSSDRELTIFAKSELNGLLLSKGTSLILVNEKRTGEELGFNPSRNWVFELKIPSIRSFTFWCVVNKYGDEKPYTFGEN